MAHATLCEEMKLFLPIDPFYKFQISSLIQQPLQIFLKWQYHTLNLMFHSGERIDQKEGSKHGENRNKIERKGVGHQRLFYLDTFMIFIIWYSLKAVDLLYSQ